jgi:hypothetical protein
LSAQSVPPDGIQTTKGALLKDLGEKLRWIEKLANELRGELAGQNRIATKQRPPA